MAMLYRPNDPNRPRRNPLITQIPISSPLGRGPSGASNATNRTGSIAAKAARAGVSVQVMGDLLDKVAKGMITLGDMDALAGVGPARLPTELGGIQPAEPIPITSARTTPSAAEAWGPTETKKILDEFSPDRTHTAPGSQLLHSRVTAVQFPGLWGPAGAGQAARTCEWTPWEKISEKIMDRVAEFWSETTVNGEAAITHTVYFLVQVTEKADCVDSDGNVMDTQTISWEELTTSTKTIVNRSKSGKETDDEYWDRRGRTSRMAEWRDREESVMRRQRDYIKWARKRAKEINKDHPDIELDETFWKEMFEHIPKSSSQQLQEAKSRIAVETGQQVSRTRAEELRQ